MQIAYWIKNFDLLGLDINFQINSNRTYISYPGLFFTCILMAFMIISLINMVIDIQNGANPSTQRTSELLQQNEGYSFPSFNFLFIVYVGDARSQYIENTKEKTYYTLKFQKQVFGTEYSSTSYDFDKCDMNLLDTLSSYGAYIPKNQVQCLNMDILKFDNLIRLENSFYLQNFTKYSLEIYRCVNSTTANYVCASKEEIDAKLQNAQIIFSFPQHEFDALNYTHPYQPKMGQRFMSINIQNSKSMNVIYKQSQSFTEQNAFYFFPLEKFDQGIEYFESILDLNSGIQNNCLGTIQLYLDNKKYIYHRSYQNILSVFGALGGTFSLLRFVFMMMLKPIQKLSFVTEMFNKISGQQKPLKLMDYFQSDKKRKIIQEYYKIIQQAIELETYMEMVLKYENNFLTFRSDKLVLLNADLINSQRLLDQPKQQVEQQKIDSREDEIIQYAPEIKSIPQRFSNFSQDYVVNNER